MDKTSFYGESGGQVYDEGRITSESGAVAKIDNVQIFGQYVLHLGTVIEGVFKKDESVTCSVDYVRRAPIAANHTMTHVLNFALKDVLINRATDTNAVAQSVDQKGSLVDEKKLRFDFSWGGAITTEQLAEVEKLVSDAIKAEIPIDAYIAPLDKAKEISSLRAVFGEVYPDPVRVIAVSPTPVEKILENPQDASWKNYSVEFCGGTHLTNTKEAQAFVLLQEEGIAKGIRRITGVTMADAQNAIEAGKAIASKINTAGELEGLALEEATKQLTAELNGFTISSALKSSLRSTLDKYSKTVTAWKKVAAAAKSNEVILELIAAAEETEDNKFVRRIDFGIDGKLAKKVQNDYGKKIKDKAFMLITADGDADRFMVIAYAPKGMGSVDCKAWVTAATEGTGGKGGGKKDSAQFTVSGTSLIDGVLEKANAF